MQTASARHAIFALMMVLFIDGMGQGIIFPILTNTITNPHATVLLEHATMHTRQLWYGFIIAVYFLMWFLGATVLGDWSDSVGRKKSLLLCLSLAAISFLMSAVAFHLHSIILLLVSRFLGGLTSGDQAIAQAAVIDLCDPRRKAVYLGLVLLSVTLGLVVGPLLGAFLQDAHWVTWFNVKTPFYFAALLAIINVLLLWLFFQETHPSKRSTTIHWTRAISVFFEAFRYANVRTLLLAYLLAQTGWSMFYIFTPNFVNVKYHIGSLASGWFVALLGLGIGIGLGVLPSLLKDAEHKLLAIIGYSGIVIVSIIFIASDSMLPLWISVIPATALFGLAVANILPLFSEVVSEQRQGWIMGVTGSVVALTAGIDSALSGLLANISIYAPYWFAVFALIIGLFVLIHYKHQPLAHNV